MSAAFNAGFDIAAARFIFSKEWLLLAGSFGNNRGCLQIRANEFLNGVDGLKRFDVKANYIVDGHITCSELCTIDRLGKVVVIMGAVRSDDNNRGGFIEIVDLRIQGGKAEVMPNDTFQFLNNLLNDIAAVTSIVFKADREVLIISTEIGEIIVIDLYQAKILYREIVDASGIVKLQLTLTGQLVSLGHSSMIPVKIWDLRLSDTQVLHLASQLEVPVNSPLKATASFRDSLSMIMSSSNSASEDGMSHRTDLQRTALQSVITCVAAHPTQDRILLGNSTGNIILWDLRMNSTVAFQTHSSRVNSICVHPDDVSQVISASTDGTIKQTNTRKLPTTAPLNVFTVSSMHNEHRLYTETDVVPVFTRDVAMVGIDCDATSRSILVNSEFGEIFCFSIR